MRKKTARIFLWAKNLCAPIRMASGPAPTEVESLPDTLRSIFYPQTLESFRDTLPSGELVVYLHRSATEEPEEITLGNWFPFMTLQDVKLALYLELKKEEAAIPEYVYLCTHGAAPGKKYLGGRNAPVEYTWNLPDVTASTPYLAAPPFAIAEGTVPLDGRFVDSAGERKLVAPVYRERLTLEDAYLKAGRGVPEFHAYLYKDLVAAIPGPKPVSEKDWNGRLYPYFPFLSVSADTPTEPQKRKAERLSRIFLRRQQFLTRLETVLSSRKDELIQLSVAGLRLLRLTWGKRKQIAGIESQFYEAPVTARRPFMRFLPTEGTGISKVYLKDGKTPDIYDPKLLVTWSQERNPTPEQDYAFAKLLVRPGLVNVPPLYSTLRLFNDGTADVIVEPPKGVKKLEPRSDLDTFGDALLEGLREFSYLKDAPDIGNAMLVLGVRMKKESPVVLSPRILRERIPIFSALFQEISPLPGERPLAMLRFKLLSNFASEDRIQAFMTQVINRGLLQGKRPTNLVDLVADEFQLDTEVARKKVAEHEENATEVALVNPEMKDYMLQYNPGIDIAIFAQHPFYTFHLYRVNSIENLQRVLTALSLLLSVSSSELEVPARAAAELAREEKAAVAAGFSAPGASAGAAPEEEENEFRNVEEAASAPAAAPAEAAPEENEFRNVEEAAPELGADDQPDYMDFFMDQQEETLEEAEAREQAEAAERKEGAALPEPPLFGERPAPPPAPGATVAELRKELAADRARPEEEVGDLPEAAGGPARPAAAIDAAENNANEGPVTGTSKSIASFFLNKLYEADRRLFNYSKTHPSLKTYVQGCQPTYGRQPAVLSEEKFQELQEEYAKDGVAFQVYPLEPGEPEKLPGVVERDYFTVLRYGTSPQRQNYYLCCRFFCTRDEMLVREVDLVSDRMRRPSVKGGREDWSKKPGECPFCRGTVIKNKRAPGANETILERPVKPKTVEGRHIFINFMPRTPHPDGFYMPCCFMENVPIRFANNPAFDKYKEWGVPPKPGAKKPTNAAAAAAAAPTEEEEAEEAEEAVLTGPRTEAGLPIVDYWVMLASVNKKYIIGGEKLPLEIGGVGSQFRGEPQIGLLPPVLDPYFSQDPTTLVSRTFNPQKLKPDAMGFLRVAVENRLRNQNDSLLAALAPYYYFNNAKQMKEHILNLVTPRVFLALNYGNLAIEFYDPAEFKRPADEELRRWSSEELQVDLQQENKEALMRAYLSFHAFEGWLLSTDTKKEFRHLALLLAQTKLLRREERRTATGITFIVLDIKKDGTMEVRCPPYGLNAETQSRNDVAFLMHHHSGIWEPIFHVDNRDEEDRRRVQMSTLVFKRSEYASWPEIVTRRFQEYIAQCSSTGRATYTSQSRINPMAMIPASLVRRTFLREPKVAYAGTIRDAYNHLGAILFREKTAEGYGPAIPIPVADDGELLFTQELALDWDDPGLPHAPVDLIARFYRKYIEPNFEIYPGYKAVRVAVRRGTGEIEAVQLRNGLYVPAGPATSPEEAAKLEGAKVEVDELEWTINHTISLEEKDIEVPGEKERMETAEFQEIFEHLRLTFANWLAAKEDAAAFRGVLEEIIYSRKLPLFEKRKRLETLLHKYVESWLTTDFADEDAGAADHATSLLRVDCTMKKTAGECGGKCTWKQEAGQCLLHVPDEVPLGEKRVSAPRVLLLRLIEELLRFGERRRQLLEKDVSQLAALDKPVELAAADGKGKQMIFPEKSTAWFELLRLNWAKSIVGEPKFLEEMSRTRDAAAPIPAPAPAPARASGPDVLPAEDEPTRLPETLITYLGGLADPKVAALRLLRGTFPALLNFLNVSPGQIGVTPETQELTMEMIDKIVEATARTVVQIDIRTDEALAAPKRRKPWGTRSFFPTYPVFVLTTTGPALLVENPEEPTFLREEATPAVLKNLIDTAKGKIMIRRAAAPVAAVAESGPIAAPV